MSKPTSRPSLAHDHTSLVRPAAGPTPSLVQVIGDDNAPFALKKRLFVPHWWLHGLMVKSAQKEQLGLGHVKIQSHEQYLIAPDTPARLFAPVLQIWNELILRALDTPGVSTVRVDVRPYLRGSAAEILADAQALTRYWCSPYTTHAWKTKAGKTQLTKSGSVNLLLCAQLQEEEGRLYLNFDFSSTLSDVVLGRGHLGASASLTPVVSLNPDICSCGKATSLKRILLYLSLELEKQTPPVTPPPWHIRGLRNEEVISAFKEAVSRAPSLYDHGVVGWDLTPPHVRVRDLVPPSSTPIVMGWTPSPHMSKAFELEKRLGARLVQGSSEEVVVLPPPPSPARIAPPKPKSTARQALFPRLAAAFEPTQEGQNLPEQPAPIPPPAAPIQAHPPPPNRLFEDPFAKPARAHGASAAPASPPSRKKAPLSESSHELEGLLDKLSSSQRRLIESRKKKLPPHEFQELLQRLFHAMNDTTPRA